MHSPGNLSTARFSQRLNNFVHRLNTVPVSARPVAFIALGTSPALVATLFLSSPTIEGIVLLSIPWIALLFDGDFQRQIFEYSRAEITFLIALPFYAYSLLWGALVVSLGRPELLGRAVGSVLFLIVIAIWPIFRANKHLERKERKIPFDHVYLAGGLLVASQQTVYLFNKFA